MELEFTQDGQTYRICLNKEGDRYTATLDDETYPVDICTIDDNCISILIGDRSFRFYRAQSNGKEYISVNGELYCFSSPEKEECRRSDYKRAEKSRGDKLNIVAPMPGSVLQINAKEGDEVEEGQCLAIVEAMKMETGLHSMIRGKVKKIHSSLGQQVDAGEVIIELEVSE